MTIALVDRAPTDKEVEKLRLILSTYQDGSGMLATEHGNTLPGWRDFERSVAICFNGIALESKAIYDVLLSSNVDDSIKYGISCKMRNTLSQVIKDGRVTIELSNAAGVFWDMLVPLKINQQNYHEYASTVGKTLIEKVESWHFQVDLNNGGNVETAKSSYLSLQYDTRNGNYQLFQFPIILPRPQAIKWTVNGRRLTGIYDNKIMLEWYGFSGGQLKYYPHYSSANWVSKVFQLEPIAESANSGILNKVAAYFPKEWEKIKDV